jgi:hypothetical protein
MTDITDLSARRWQNVSDPEAHKPIDALRETIRQIEAGEVEADHVVICLGATKDGAAVTDWLQAGTFDVYGQRGLLDTVRMFMLLDAIGAPA